MLTAASWVHPAGRLFAYLCLPIARDAEADRVLVVSLTTGANLHVVPARMSESSIAWPEAIARLAAERTRAVTCATQARSLDGDTAALAAAYGVAKAEMDGIIAGLSVALAEGRQPKALDDLPRRIETAVTLREAFCRAVAERFPPAVAGAKLALSDVLGIGKLAKELVEAGLAIWQRVADADKLRRDTIRAQLEATRWPNFADLPPAG
jgi:hypothetical protein